MGLGANTVDLFVVGIDFYLGSTRGGRLKDGWCDFRTLGQIQVRRNFGDSYVLGAIWYLATRVPPRELRSFKEHERQNIWLRQQGAADVTRIIIDASQTTKGAEPLVHGREFRLGTEDSAISALRRTHLAPAAMVISGDQERPTPLLSFLDEKYDGQQLVLVPPDFKLRDSRSGHRARFSHDDLEQARLWDENSWKDYQRSKDQADLVGRWAKNSFAELHRWLFKLVEPSRVDADADARILEKVKVKIAGFLTSDPVDDRLLARDRDCIEFIARKLIADVAGEIIAEREPSTGDSEERKFEVVWHEDFLREYRDLPKDFQGKLRAEIALLESSGPRLGFPHANTIKSSLHPNMKKLRFHATDGVWRVAFAFDSNHQAVLLAAGDKAGVSEKTFHRRLLDKADKRLASHVAKIQGSKQEGSSSRRRAASA
jgi:hypothetical protein